MRRALKVGDAVSYRVGGRRMRGLVVAYLPLRARGEEPRVAVTKRNGSAVHWMERKALRKLPAPR
jgi:hypothetical protein